MKCSEFQEQAAAYALDALSEPERIACARHLEEEGPHEGCDELLARYERVVDALSAGVPHTQLTPTLWRAIETRMEQRGDQAGGAVVPIGRRDEPPGAADARDDRSSLARGGTARFDERHKHDDRRRWREGLAWAAAAATLLGALWSHQTTQQLVRNTARERTRAEESLASTNAQLESTQAARAECSAALQQLTQRIELRRDAVSMLEDPATRIAPMTAASTQPYKATALYNPKAQRALVISSSVKQLEGKDYELWVIAAGEAPRPAGFMRFDSTGVSIGEFDPALLQGKAPAALAVSLEPTGGRPTPTEVVLIAKLQG